VRALLVLSVLRRPIAARCEGVCSRPIAAVSRPVGAIFPLRQACEALTTARRDGERRRVPASIDVAKRRKTLSGGFYPRGWSVAAPRITLSDRIDDERWKLHSNCGDCASWRDAYEVHGVRSPCRRDPTHGH